MSVTRDKINKAYKEKEFFFKPWIGLKYEKGVPFLKNDVSRKVMVIGASRYCEYSNNQEKNNEAPCPHLNHCCFCSDYDSMLAIASDCPFIKDAQARNNTHKDYLLSDINSASILKSYYGKSPKAYKVFQNALNAVLNCNEAKRIWSYLAFTNYFQPIVWGKDGDRTRTPRIREQSVLYDESRQIIERQIELLEPDIIILWQSSAIKDSFKSLFPNAVPTHFKHTIQTSKGTMDYPVYNLKINDRTIKLIPSPHPSDPARANPFFSTLGSMSVSYVTPYHFTIQEDFSEQELWGAFTRVLESVVIDEF